MELDKRQALKALTDGFCVIFGEKYRKFLEVTGAEVLELGIKNGEMWARASAFKGDRISMYFEMFEEGIVKKEEIDDIIKHLKIFFNEEEIELIKNKKDFNNDSAHLFMGGVKIYLDLFVKVIEEKDVTLKSPKPFDYFKQFKLTKEKKFSSCTLFGEGGLGLDIYNVVEMKYYKEENELFYPIEAIARKYHYLGMLIAKEQALKHWADEILKKIKPETNSKVKGLLRDIIYNLARFSVADEIILDIQNKTGVIDGFNTHDQISERLSKANIKLPTDLFLKKK